MGVGQRQAETKQPSERHVLNGLMLCVPVAKQAPHSSRKDFVCAIREQGDVQKSYSHCRCLLGDSTHRDVHFVRPAMSGCRRSQAVQSPCGFVWSTQWHGCLRALGKGSVWSLECHVGEPCADACRGAQTRRKAVAVVSGDEQRRGAMITGVSSVKQESSRLFSYHASITSDWPPSQPAWHSHSGYATAELGDCNRET